MGKNILVKTPLTSDGNMPVIGADGKQVYSESILGFPAKAILEKRNQSLPGPLKCIIEDYDGPAAVFAEGEEPAKVSSKKTVANATA